MAAILWSHNVSYNPQRHEVTFFSIKQQGNKAIWLIDYYRELYPHKSWIKLAILAIPELASVRNKRHLKFYSL